MKRPIAEGADLHDFTATLLYGARAPPQRQERSSPKGVGLGKVFGGGPTGLAKQIGAPLDQVKAAVEGYDEVYPEVKRWPPAPAGGPLRRRGGRHRLWPAPPAGPR